MALHILRFKHHDRTHWGIVRDGLITPIPGVFETTGAFIRANPVETLMTLDAPAIEERDVEWLSPVTRNQQFICQGANYRQHMIESGIDPDVKAFNMVFTKASSCIVPADADVVRPRHVRFLDYEIELGLVLRCDVTSPRTISDADLYDYIAGAVIVNDYSARDIQIPQMQFYKGKSFRTFGPVGPYLCLLVREDMASLAALDLRLTVNGVVRQQDSTANLVHRPAETLSELSEVHDLYAGDLLATGTPSGCALSVPSPFSQRLAALLPETLKWKMFLKIQEKRPHYLRPGDLVEARIANADKGIDLGLQRNRIVGDAQ